MRNFEKYIDEIVGSIYELSKLKEEGKFVITHNNWWECDNQKQYIIVDTNKCTKEKLKEFLLEEYKEPYKLTKFEYDLLLWHRITLLSSYHFFKDSDLLLYMKNEGYFKDISEEEHIKEILDNCKIIEE